MLLDPAIAPSSLLPALTAVMDAAASPLSIPQAVILGVVEGVTEYLPVSSTGHLVVASSLLGLYDGGAREQAVHDFEIIIQGGAILAVLGLYFPRFVQMLRGLLGHDPIGRRIFINICIAFVPAAGLGFLLNKKIKAVLMAPVPVIIAMIAGGAFMIIVDMLVIAPRRKALAERPAAPAPPSPPSAPAAPAVRQPGDLGVEDMTPLHALIVGLVQVVALIPGTSRSMMTIVGGVFTGLRPSAAAEFSFLLGMPTLLAATLYSLYKNLKESSASGEPNIFKSLGVGPMLVGMVVAAIFAAVSVKWLVGFLNRRGLALFGYYRLAMGALLIILLVQGVLKVAPDASSSQKPASPVLNDPGTILPAPQPSLTRPVKTPMP